MAAVKRCPLCGYDRLAEETDEFAYCSRCKTLTRINPDDSAKDDYPDEFYSHDLLLSEKRWLRIIEDHSPTDSRKSLLDLGCGNGAFMEHAAGNGWQTVGVEENPTMVDLGRQKNLNIRQSDLDTFEWPGEWSFDVVRIWFALEHIRQPGELLGNAVKHLIQNGLLAVAVPNDAGRLSRLVMKNPEDRFWEHPLHLHHFPPFGLERWIEDLGFELLAGEADRPTELMRDKNLPLQQAWSKARETVPELCRIFYELGVGRTRELLFRKK
jgi:SAM-dependent methyltransferase